MRRFICVLARTTFRFHRCHWHAGTVHFDIQNRNVAAGYLRQIELYGALDFDFFPVCNVTANGFGVSFDGFTRDGKTSQ